MNADNIKAFLAVEKHLNFSLAAEELGISQPTLSKHIKALEREIGAPLFTRSARGVSPTMAGIKFSEHARVLTEDFDKMVLSMKAFSPGQKRNISLASVPVMKTYQITGMIAAFRAAQPDIHIDIREADTSFVIQALASGNADVAYAGTHTLKGNDFNRYDITEDALVMIVGKNHRFSNQELISLCDAIDEEYLFLDAATDVYNHGFDQCKKAGFVPKLVNPQHRHLKIETIIDLVSKGFGVSLLMRKMAEHYATRDIKILGLTEKPVMKFALITKNESISEACRLFIQFALDYFDKRDKNQSTSV